MVATVVSLRPPEPKTTPPVPELFEPFKTTAPVPAALIDCLVVCAGLAVVVLAYGEAIDIVEFVENLIELFAGCGVAQAGCPAIARVCLIAIKKPRSLPVPMPRRKVVGYGRVLLAAVPVPVHPVKLRWKVSRKLLRVPLSVSFPVNMVPPVIQLL